MLFNTKNIVTVLIITLLSSCSDEKPDVIHQPQSLFTQSNNATFKGKEKFDLREVKSLTVSNLNRQNTTTAKKPMQDKFILAWNNSKEVGIQNFEAHYKIVATLTNGEKEEFYASDTGLIKHKSDYSFQIKNPNLLNEIAS